MFILKFKYVHCLYTDHNFVNNLKFCSTESGNKKIIAEVKMFANF